MTSAFSAGYETARAGGAVANNPYPFGPHWRWWIEGYNAFYHYQEN